MRVQVDRTARRGARRRSPSRTPRTCGRASRRRCPVLANDVSPVGPRARRAVRRRHRDRRPRLGRDPHEHRGAGHRIRGARPAAAVQLHDLRRRRTRRRPPSPSCRCRRSSSTSRRSRSTTRVNVRAGDIVDRAGARQRLPPRRGRASTCCPSSPTRRPQAASPSSTTTRCASRRPTSPARTRPSTRSPTTSSRPRAATRHASPSSARDAGENRAPLPTPLTSRTFAGSAVQDRRAARRPRPRRRLGRCSPASRRRRPSAASSSARARRSRTRRSRARPAPTPSTYEVQRHVRRDRRSGTIRIGVIPRPAVQLPPKAVDDAIEMKPGRTASVEVLLNDSDPSGYELHVADLPEVDEGIEAEIRDRRRVVVDRARDGGRVHDPLRDLERPRRCRHRLPPDRGHGGRRDPAADRRRPGHRARGGRRRSTRVNVSPLDDATNPGGLVEDLVVTVEGPNADRAEVLADGSIDVKPGRRALRRRVPPHERARRPRRDGVRHRAPDPGRRRPGRGDAAPKTPEELAAEEKAKFPAPHLADLAPIVVPMNGQHRLERRRHRRRAVGQAGARPHGVGDERATKRPSSTARRCGTCPRRTTAARPRVTFEVTDGTSATDPDRPHGHPHHPDHGRRPELQRHAADVHPAHRDDRGGRGAARDRPALVERPAQPRQHRAASPYTNLAGTTADIQAEIVGRHADACRRRSACSPAPRTRLTFDVNFE